MLFQAGKCTLTPAIHTVSKSSSHSLCYSVKTVPLLSDRADALLLPVVYTCCWQCAFCSNLPPAKLQSGSDDIIAHIHISPAGGRRIRAANYLSPWWGGLREWRLVCDSAAGADWHLGYHGKVVTTPLAFGNQREYICLAMMNRRKSYFNGDNIKHLKKLLIFY